MGTGLSRPDGSPINFGDADDDISEASERLLKEWKEEQKKADAEEAKRQADLDEKQREWTAYLNSPEYAQEQQKKRKQLEDAFQYLRRRFLREHGARFGLEVPPPPPRRTTTTTTTTRSKRPPNPVGGAIMEAASRVLADPDAPRTREEAVEQVMAATQCLAAGRGVEGGNKAASGRRALGEPEAEAHPLKRKMRRECGGKRQPRGAARRRSGKGSRPSARARRSLP